MMMGDLVRGNSWKDLISFREVPESDLSSSIGAMSLWADLPMVAVGDQWQLSVMWHPAVQLGGRRTLKGSEKLIPGVSTR